MDKQADLRKWFKEKWVDISRKKKGGGHPECGRDDADEGGGYPKCRPARAAARMTKKQKAYAVRAKRSKPQGVGGKPTMVATFKKKAMFNPEIDSILENLEKEAIMAAKPFKGVGKGKFTIPGAPAKKGLMERAGAAVSKLTSGGAGATAKRVGTAVMNNPGKTALVVGGAGLAANAVRRPQTNPQTGQPTTSNTRRAITGGLGAGAAALGARGLMKKVAQDTETILDSLEKEAKKGAKPGPKTVAQMTQGTAGNLGLIAGAEHLARKDMYANAASRLTHALGKGTIRGTEHAHSLPASLRGAALDAHTAEMVGGKLMMGIPQAIGAAKAATSKTKNLKEIAKQRRHYIPGVGTHHFYKAVGTGIRGPEVRKAKAEQDLKHLKAKLDKKASGNIESAASAAHMLHPIGHGAAALGILAAGLTKTKSLKEIGKKDSDKQHTTKGRLSQAANLIPGVAPYRLTKRTASVLHGPEAKAARKEVEQEHLKQERDKLKAQIAKAEQMAKKASAETAHILDTLEKEARALPKAHKLEAKMHKARAAQHGAAAKRLHPGLLVRMMGMNTPERRNALKDIEAKSGAQADNIQAQLDLAKAQRNLKTTERLGRNAGKRS